MTYSNQEYIQMANKIHNNYYNYNKTFYINSSTKIIVTCPIHGDFSITAKEHINCRASGCKKCSDDKKRKTTEQFITEANKIHNNLYSYNKTKYFKDDVKVCITCKKHGEFWQTPNSHLQFHGCPKCKIDKSIQKRTSSLNEFLSKANKIHNNLYDYSSVEYTGSNDKIKIICSKHGVFEQTPNKHINAKQGCPKCKYSKNELLIDIYLHNNNIKHQHQKIFKDCKGDKNYLRFDFYLPDYNTCIEYDGELHYKTFRHKKRKKDIVKLKQTKKYDIIKTKYCKRNNIKMLRLPYWHRNKIIELITDFILSIK